MPTPLGSQHAQLTRWALWLRNFWPGPVRIDLQELLRMALGVALGLLVTGMLSRWWTDVPTSTWMVSSLGASAVLLFGMPASPLAQPWPVLGGTVVSALVGALCQRLVPDLAVAAALSVGLSILLMVPLRCMHPPGPVLPLSWCWSMPMAWRWWPSPFCSMWRCWCCAPWSTTP
jgi:CBS domain-containing membrane protein